MENMTQKIKNRTVFKSFVLFGGFLSIREFFTHIETSPLPDLYSAPNVIEQWGFLTQDIRLLWSFPRTSDTHIAERSTVELSLLVWTTRNWVCNNRDSNIQPSEWEVNALVLHENNIKYIIYLVMYLPWYTHFGQCETAEWSRTLSANRTFGGW